jgi:HEAT repeat protein
VKDELRQDRIIWGSLLRDFQGLSGEDLKVFENLVQNNSVDVRNELARVLGLIGKGPRVNECLDILERLKDDDPWIQETVAEAVGKIGIEQPTRSIYILRDLAKSESSYVRKNVAKALAKILNANKGVAVKDEVLSWVRNPNKWIREVIATSIGKIRHIDNHFRVKVLTRLARDTFSNVRRAAARALLSVKREYLDDAMLVFKTLAQDNYWRIRKISVEFLSLRVGVDKTDALDILRELILDDVASVRLEAAIALKRLSLRNPKYFLPEVKRLVFEDRDCLHPEVLKVFIGMLHECSRVLPRDSIEILRDIFQDEDPEVRYFAKNAMLEIFNKTKKASRP